MATYESLVGQQKATQSISIPVLRDVASFFHNNVGELYSKAEVIDTLSEDVDVEPIVLRLAVDNLALDSVDPVIQISTASGPHVGIVSYSEEGFYYTYEDHHDAYGRQRRSVCAQCVHDDVSISDVHHYTRSTDEYDEDEAESLLAAHYYIDHEGMSAEEVLSEVGVDGATTPHNGSITTVSRLIDPEQVDISIPVKTGASLLSDTTIGGNTAVTSANGSDLDIATLTTVGAAGTAPVSNGDGTLSMVAVEGTEELSVSQSLINL